VADPRFHSYGVHGAQTAARPRIFAVALLASACAHPVFVGSFERREERLFDGRTFAGWVHVSADKNAKREETWQILPSKNPDDSVLVCLGKPFGYLRTERVFEDFELSLEWSYLNDPHANSGIFVHTVGKDAIWPRAIQVQLHRPEAGSIFPQAGARTDKLARARDAGLALNKWHRCVIVSRAGMLSVTINGGPPVEVAGCHPRQGSIGLQSEGSTIHFRRIRLRPFK
jgi:hypothetical protein